MESWNKSMNVGIGEAVQCCSPSWKGSISSTERHQRWFLSSASSCSRLQEAVSSFKHNMLQNVQKIGDQERTANKTMSFRKIGERKSWCRWQTSFVQLRKDMLRINHLWTQIFHLWTYEGFLFYMSFEDRMRSTHINF